MYRIVEYKNHFEIEKQYFEDIWFYFLGIYALYVKEERERWFRIRTTGKFKTKEECLEYISDLSKYPIYHKAV